MKNWQKYQEEAAKFFRTLGLYSTIEAKIDGARGKHWVDVYVQGNLHGIRFKWVVECKAWRTNVPKEKVLALADAKAWTRILKWKRRTCLPARCMSTK